MGAGPGLPEQPDAQCPARRTAGAGRSRAAGAVGLSAARRADGLRRQPVSVDDLEIRFDHARRPGLHRGARGLHAARGRRDRNANAVQRLPDRQPHPAGGVAGVVRPRHARRDRADRPAHRGDRLHEPAARRRDPRPAASQRRGAAGAAAPDARPLQCRRGDAHRRGAVRVAARGGPGPGPAGRIELHHVARAISPGHRGRSGQARAREPGRPVLAAHARGGNRPGAPVQSGRRGGDVRHRRRAAAGQDQRGLAAAR